MAMTDRMNLECGVIGRYPGKAQVRTICEELDRGGCPDAYRRSPDRQNDEQRVSVSASRLRSDGAKPRDRPLQRPRATVHLRPVKQTSDCRYSFGQIAIPNKWFAGWPVARPACYRQCLANQMAILD